MIQFNGWIFSLELFILSIILIAANACKQDPDSLSTIEHIVIQNNNIQEQQDLSDFFTTKTITVTGKDATIVPGMVRTFEFFNNTLYLINRQPRGVITALSENGTVQWQLSANSDPLSAFTALSGFHLDRERRKISVFDDQKNRIYVYNLNGDFLGVEDMPSLYINDVYVEKNDTRLFSISAYKNEFEGDGKKSALIAYFENNNQSQPDTILLSQDSYNSVRAPFVDYRDFFSNDDGELFYHRDFDDTIFQIKNLTIDELLTFSFAENDKRNHAQSNPNTNPLLLQHFLDENIPYSSFIVPQNGYVMAGYVYNFKELFTMVDIKSGDVVFNTQNYICDGINFSGRLDYSRGILLNQMHAGNYYQFNEKQTGNDTLVFEEENLVYTILIPKW